MPDSYAMDKDKRLHDLIVDFLKQKLSREYSEIRVNPAGNPDLTLSSHGLVLAVVEVETEKTITPEQGERWKSLAQPGTKVIVMVPKHAKVKATELLWKQGIADRVAVGHYEIALHMP